MNKFKIIICISVILVQFGLISCGESTTTNTSNSKAINYENSFFSMQVPGAWKEVDAKTIDSTLPLGSFYVWKSTNTLNGVYPKLTIIKEKLLIATDTLEYANTNIEKTPLISKSYTKLDLRDDTINNAKAKIHIYEAQTSDSSPITLFIQTYIIYDRYTGYVITFNTSPSENKDFEKYVTLLKTFKVKQG